MLIIVLLKVLHITVAIFLIMVVLLQTGKGAEMGAAFGGASQTLFGSGGPAGFMAKLTTTAAVVFMFTSLSLAYFSSTVRAVQTAPPAVPVQQTEAPVEMPDVPPVEMPDVPVDDEMEPVTGVEEVVEEAEESESGTNQ